MFRKTLLWVCRLIAAILMLQTLYFKFTAAPESTFIFGKLGFEPHGRIGVGVLELLASVLILLPRLSVIGAVLAAALMCGAIWAHVTLLGIDVMADGGRLFASACIVLFCSVCCIILQFKKLKTLVQKI
jgi:putative oxidoreductase